MTAVQCNMPGCKNDVGFGDIAYGGAMRQKHGDITICYSCVQKGKFNLEWEIVGLGGKWVLEPH